VGAPLSSLGYPEDDDPTSEFNMISNDPFMVAVSVILGTYASRTTESVTLPTKEGTVTDAPVMAPTSTEE